MANSSKKYINDISNESIVRGLSLFFYYEICFIFANLCYNIRERFHYENRKEEYEQI